MKTDLRSKGKCGVVHPYGLFIGTDQHIYLADAEASRVLEIDPNGNILGSFGTAGREPGQFAGAHALAVSSNRKIFVAEVFNWRVEKFVQTGSHP